MKRFTPLLLLLLIIACKSPAQELPSKTIWEGKLGPIRLILKLSEDSLTKKKTAVFDSPDQSALGIEVSELKVTRDSINAYSAKLSGGFTGAFNSAKTELNGTWMQRGTSIPLVMKRITSVAMPNRPQTPKAPFPYHEIITTYYNKDKSIRYGATLTIPDLTKDYPAVVMITGSGQEDRNETLFGHKLFWVIADHLTRNGVAVLRVDDRGIGQSTGNVSEATSADFSQDVLASVEFLKNQVGIDVKHIGLIGHSEGGMIAPMVANQSKDIAFIVSMAGLGIKGADIMMKQSRAAYSKLGFKEEDLARIDGLNKMLLDLNLKYDSQDELKTAYQKLMQEWLTQQPEPFLIKSGFKGPNANAILEQSGATFYYPWTRYFLKFDPATTLTKIKIPVLAINGEKDTQVTAQENLEGFNKYLTQAGNKNFKTIMFPGLNHFFQHAKTGEADEYSIIEETISPEVLTVMTEWIRDNVH